MRLLLPSLVHASGHRRFTAIAGENPWKPMFGKKARKATGREKAIR
jgi:hypothetical protein